jgi:dihydrolipoamide dehydrogenase
MRTFDIVVVGGGPSGMEAAGRLADRGLSVAVVEDRLLGGECAHWACIPSKALLRPPEVLAETGRIPGARESLNGGPNVIAVLGRRDEVIGVDERTGKPGDALQTATLDRHRVPVVRGRARLIGERRIATDGEELEARQAVILAGGSQPLLPPIEGLAGLHGVWTNEEATTAEEIPRRLVIVGAGPVGVEMAQAYQKLGSQVTLIEGELRVLPKHEEFACVQVADALRKYGVDVRTGQRVVRFARNSDGYAVTTSSGDTIDGDEVLVAVGRSAPPRTSGSRSLDSILAASSRSTATCACKACRGSTRLATSTAAHSLPIWVSTRRELPPIASSGMRLPSPTARTAATRRA